VVAVAIIYIVRMGIKPSRPPQKTAVEITVTGIEYNPSCV